jgi:transposase-like protein
VVSIEEVPTMRKTDESHGDWRSWVEELARSGESVREFAARHGLKPGTLSYWRWKLRQAEQARSSVRRPRPPKARSRLEVASLPAGSFIEVQASGVGDRFELELANGRRLRIPSGFEAQALQRLLGVLEVQP